MAEAEASTGKKLARYWLHTRYLLVNGKKMSKSKGTLIRLADLVEKKINPLAFRYLILSTHFSSPLNFTWEPIQAAQDGPLLGQLQTIPEAPRRATSQPGERPVGAGEQARAVGIVRPRATALLELLREFANHCGRVSARECCGNGTHGDRLLAEGLEIEAQASRHLHILHQCQESEWTDFDRLRGQ